jgi:hypothetical protein
VAELVRLAPAADPTQMMIGICRPTGADELMMWGLVDSGLSWWELVRGERGDRLSTSPPPERFTVSSARRGAVTISRGGRVVCTLNRGEITTPPPGDPGLYLDFIGLHPRAFRGLVATDEVLSRGPFGTYLRAMTDAFHHDVLTKLGADRYDPQGADENYPRELLLQFIERIVIRVRDASHGGTLLFVPNDWRHEDARIRDRLAIKYPIDDAETWPLLIRAVGAHRQYYDLLLPIWDRPTVPQRDLHRLLLLDEDLADATDLVRDRAGLVASLCAVDGAVVLTDRLRLLGFGAEIIAQSPTLEHVVVAEDADATVTRPRPLEDLGTRHRSALRFCSSHEQVAALVVSQDGDVRAMLRTGGDVVMWPYVTAGTRV